MQQVLWYIFAATHINICWSVTQAVTQVDKGLGLIGLLNFGTDYGAEPKFATHKKLIVLNIVKYRYDIAWAPDCVNKSHVMSRDNFAFSFILNISNTSQLEWPSITL